MICKILHINRLLPLIIILSACSTNSLYKETSLKPEMISQKINSSVIYQSNAKVDFNDFISGVNTAIVITNEQLELSLEEYGEFYRKYNHLIRNYLSGIGFENIAITQDEQNRVENSVSLEQTAKVYVILDVVKNYLVKAHLLFKACNGDEFKFSLNVDYYLDPSWDREMFKVLTEMYWENIPFNSSKRLALKKQFTPWNFVSLKKHFGENGCDEFEGIYEKYGGLNIENYSKYSIGVIKENGVYKIIYLDGAVNKHNWSEGELKGSIKETSIKDFYKVNWIMSDKSVNDNVYLTTNKYNFLEFDFLDAEYGFKIKYLKMFPSSSDIINSSNEFISSGTGFLISKAGYLVTNYHVVKDVKNIEVEIKGKNAVKKFKADVVLENKGNDLALLKIDDDSFILNKEIPFKIKKSEAPIGTSVFTLGYPMIETMGESVKLSDGIISSNYGFMSDKSTYQLTVPINPGNSGGPLFDREGNLVGIVNAKYTGAENVTYAIKSNILLDLIKDAKLEEPKNSVNFAKLSLADQFDELDELVCLIKAYE